MRFCLSALFAMGILSGLATCRPEAACIMEGGQERSSGSESDASQADVQARSRQPDPIPVLFWNVENYFDAVDDAHGHDNDRRGWWTQQLYEAKTAALLEVLKPLAEQHAILTFAELEHKAVLQQLRDGLPKPEAYQIVYHQVRHARIKQGALVPFPVRRSNLVPTIRGQRPILELETSVAGESLVLFINHWKSRRGGLSQTEDRRLAAAAALQRRIQRLRKQDPRVSVLVLGDFNDEPHNRSLREGLRSHPDRDQVRGNPERLWNCLQSQVQNPQTSSATGLRLEKIKGTTSFRGRWQMLDQILISPGLLDEQGLQVAGCTVHTARGRLVRRDRPWRFGDRGVPSQYRGYSDHLPVVVYLRSGVSGAR